MLARLTFGFAYQGAVNDCSPYLFADSPALDRRSANINALLHRTGPEDMTTGSASLAISVRICTWGFCSRTGYRGTSIDISEIGYPAALCSDDEQNAEKRGSEYRAGHEPAEMRSEDFSTACKKQSFDRLRICPGRPDADRHMGGSSLLKVLPGDRSRSYRRPISA